MKITALEEYGLRCLVQLAKAQKSGKSGMSIREISEAEGLSIQYVSKITAHLKKANFITATRGVKGGYALAKTADQIHLADISVSLGNVMFDSGFCFDHSGSESTCVHQLDCSIRSVWNVVSNKLRSIMEEIKLSDIIAGEEKTNVKLLKMLSPLESELNLTKR
jgi:Rrf2 family protein